MTYDASWSSTATPTATGGRVHEGVEEAESKEFPYGARFEDLYKFSKGTAQTVHGPRVPRRGQQRFQHSGRRRLTATRS